jgi:hypothetical protein
MWTCNDCRIRRNSNTSWPLYSPRCLHCGARLIQTIKALKGIRPTAELSTRCAQVLSDWVAYGHLESELRALSIGPLASQPDGLASDLESAPLKKAKPR